MQPYGDRQRLDHEEQLADQVAERVLGDTHEPVRGHEWSHVPEGISGTQNLALSHSTPGTLSMPVVHRAVISYRDLRWADFKDWAPAGTTLAAETSSGFYDSCLEAQGRCR